eukprot:CAMPEP_0201476850 /NCGR_PEP_ID=MMETSP0151_2-20130828/1979_1 /ASSEMBLY_ACC=CAM_ASM_000257 /TAXON_ID=200890 /ORGANISM="Paramoeba atlantica, Strain 621/1 / CCAP 1560/9" /LENGTH=112 /DNA_ID=CAMNT_0047857359 /DNA_START=33 /DNA_END=371 /DNA_ORIENTATION=+
MPYVAINTNVADNGTVLKALSTLVADYLKKAEKYVMVSMNQSKCLFGGSDDPCAFVDVRALGISKDSTNYPEFSRQICTVINKELGIEMERIFLNFSEIERTNWGWNGCTFG